MDATRAVDLINGLSYRPGWEISAQPVPSAHPSGGNVYVTLSFDTVDTDRDCAQRGYDTPKHMEVPGILASSDFDTPDDLYAFVFATIMELEMHEAREFLRVKGDGTYRAPFHPHRPEGQKLYGTYFG